jgi:hypothetical protein
VKVVNPPRCQRIEIRDEAVVGEMEQKALRSRRQREEAESRA